MNEQLIALEFLQPNPYQPRQHEDPAAVQELAENIERNATEEFDGLLQAPTVRPIGDGHYQLAFGHTRKAAFAHLFNQGKSSYGRMRVYVRDLTDVQMFEAAVAENIKRRDLNPIEQAESMRRYMDEFGKTSKEAGEFFNCSEENVRAKARLLNLPAPVQEKMRAGEVNETAARSLLTLTRILPKNEKVLQEAIKDILDGEKPEEVVGRELSYNPATKVIHSGHFPTNQKKFKHLPDLNVDDLQAIYMDYFGDFDDMRKEQAMNTLRRMYAKDAEPITDDEIRIVHLLRPPACTACPYFAQINQTAICGFVSCFNRKIVDAKETELHKVSEITGIAIYSEDDGPSTAGLSRYEDKHKKYFAKKGEDLRLKRASRDSYMNQWEGVPSDITVVVVGKTRDAWKKADEKARGEVVKQGQEAVAKVDYERIRAVADIIDAQAGIFIWETVAPVFSTLLDGVNQVDFLERMADTMTDLDTTDFELPKDAFPDDKRIAQFKKPARLAYRRKQIIVIMLDSVTYVNDITQMHGSKTPITHFAKTIHALATTWGVKLPKDFDKQAAVGDEAVKLAIAEYDKSRGAK